MMVSRRTIGLAVLAAGLPPGKLLAAGGLERLQLHSAPRAAPEFTLRDAAGDESGAGRFLGQGLVLNFWATWCPPCVEEMPALARLSRELAPDRIRVIAASQDRGGVNAVQAFYERTRITGLPIWLDPRGAAARAFGARGLPTTVLLDAEGREVARLEGAAAWDAAEAVATIRRLIPGGQPAPAPDSAET